MIQRRLVLAKKVDSDASISGLFNCVSYRGTQTEEVTWEDAWLLFLT